MTYAWMIENHDETVSVLRDDLVPGGTKRRALDVLLRNLPYADIAYAGTIFGHGALALALACEQAGRRAHLYLSCNDTEHEMMQRLRATDAVIVSCAAEPVAALLDRAQKEHAFTFPLGFDMPEFHTAMQDVLKTMPLRTPSEIWCAAVSGTMAQALKNAFPGVPVRSVAVTKSASAEYAAPEKYHQPALQLPPYTSCPYTDAKVWQFAQKHAAPGALIWNIAG